MKPDRLDKLIEEIRKVLDDAYSRGFPIIIVEPHFLDDLRDRLIVMSFINGYIQQKKDELAYRSSRN